MPINGSFLYERRIEAGLSQSDIANALGYSVQLISMWESGKNSPSLPCLGKYASLLGLDLEGIINSKVSKKNNLCDELSFNAIGFANNIKRLRKKKKLTQKQLADSISCNVNQLIKYEKGSSFPSIEQFISLSKVFKTRLDVLYFCLDYKPEDIQKEKKKTKVLLIVLPIVAAVSASSLTLGITLSVVASKQRNNVITPEDDKPLKIKWTEPKEVSYTLGSYPQSRVVDESLINILDSIGTTNEYGYVQYNNEYYEKVISKEKGEIPIDFLGVDPESSLPRFNNNIEVENNTPYWFKVEPLNWRLLGTSDNLKILVCDSILDADIIFDENNSTEYKDSYIRNWLNNTFYNKAFINDKDRLVGADIFGIDVKDNVYIPSITKYWGESIPASEYARSKAIVMSHNKDIPIWIINNEEEQWIDYPPCYYAYCGGCHTWSIEEPSEYNSNDSYLGGILPIIIINAE